MLIDMTEAAQTALLNVRRDIRGGTLRIIGVHTGADVAIELPRVEDPDTANNDHWTPCTAGEVAVVLNAGNNARAIVSSGVLRISKPTSAGNAYGVEYT